MFRVWQNYLHFEWGYIGHTKTEEIYDIHCRYFEGYLHKKHKNVFMYWHAEYSQFWHTTMALSSHHSWSFFLAVYHAMAHWQNYNIYGIFLATKKLSSKPLNIKIPTDQRNRMVWKARTAAGLTLRSRPGRPDGQSSGSVRPVLSVL